jgi:hypothetical protein
MAEQDLNDPDIHALFQQVGGIGMAEGMRSCFGMDLGFSDRDFQDFVESRIMHGLRGDRLLPTSASGRRKEPDEITVPGPQSPEGSLQSDVQDLQ